ncbi:metalloregulator ArsR/SmtB family transcription factor [Kribbella sp. NPDC026611]|uniref:ArsR/SmtB family transcription factor n=1 Tax=Kribbella sp. NPDC026611 TaxID=3154911 RepID=UPI0033EA755D
MTTADRPEQVEPGAAGAAGVPGVTQAGSGRQVFRPDAVFEALGDPTRRVVFEVLVNGGGGTATSIASEVPVTRQAVVQHLGVLREAGLVESRRQGREVRFELRSSALNATAAWMADVAAQWDQRLAVITELAESRQAAETDEES